MTTNELTVLEHRYADLLDGHEADFNEEDWRRLIELRAENAHRLGAARAEAARVAGLRGASRIAEALR